MQIIGAGRLPATVPFHASQMYGRNVSPCSATSGRTGGSSLDPADEIAGPMLVVHDGKVRL